MKKGARVAWTAVLCVWASPASLLGVTTGGISLLTGGAARRTGHVLEFHGGVSRWLLERMPNGQFVLAMTLGHTILGKTDAALDIARAHELVHVRQYERWGPLFIPAYLLASLGLWLAGRDPYRDNPFEREADGDDDSSAGSCERTMATLAADARRLADALKRWEVKAVFAESCTGGLVAASLAKVPGISDFLCGSAVTYRKDTKHQWLGVSEQRLVRPGPVSAVVAREMAAGVLAMTPEADWSASVTGHLGPDAPQRLDGLVYIGISRRTSDQPVSAVWKATASRHGLVTESRSQRQREAAALVLRQLLAAIHTQMKHHER